MMEWFPCFPIRVLLLLFTLITLVSSHKIPEKRANSVHLEHICANLHSTQEEGLPVIFLHGLSQTMQTWDGIYENIPLLAHRRVCMYDARNHGDSEWNDTFSIDVLTDDLENFMDKMKIEKAALVGHSLGGLTAMKYAIIKPSRVEKIFIEDIGAHVPRDSFIHVAYQLKLLADSIATVPKDVDEKSAKKYVYDFFLKTIEREINDVFFQNNPMRRRNGIWEWKCNIAAFQKAVQNLDSYLGTMEGTYDGRAVFMYGTNSPFKVGEQIETSRKHFPNSEFIAVEGAGHAIHSTYPEFLKELIKFLK